MPPYANQSAVNSAIIGGKILSFLGYFFSVFFGICLIVAPFSEIPPSSFASGYIFCLILFVASILLIHGGRSIKKRIRRFRSYTALLSTGVNSLQQIADNTYTSCEFVLRDMENMIRRGYFTGVSLDPSAGRVRFFSGQSPNLYTPPRVAPPGCSVHCPGCGAVNSVTPGVAKRCEYCGTFLSN